MRNGRHTVTAVTRNGRHTVTRNGGLLIGAVLTSHWCSFLHWNREAGFPRTLTCSHPAFSHTARGRALTRPAALKKG